MKPIDLFVSKDEEQEIKKHMTKKNKKDPNRARDIPFTNKRLKESSMKTYKVVDFTVVFGNRYQRLGERD